MKNKLLTLISCIFLIFVFVLAAQPCISAEAKPTSKVKTLTIGNTLPLNVPSGVETKRAMELIIDELNRSGGLTVKGQAYKVNVISYDDGASADKGRAAAERLIFQDKVKYIVGGILSQPLAAQVEVTERNKVLLCAHAGTEKIIAPGTRYSFRTAIIRSFVVSSVQHLLTVCPNTKTVLLAAPDDEVGHSNMPIWLEVLNRFNLKGVPLYYPFGETDFSPMAFKTLEINPDIYNTIASLGGTDLGLQLKALHAAGFKGKAFASSFISLDKMKQVCTNEAMEGLICQMLSYYNPNASKRTLEFKQKFTERYKYWTDITPVFLASWDAFFTAVRKANSLEVEDICNAMQGIKFDSIVGDGCLMVKGKYGTQKIESNRYCDLVVPINYGVVRDGKAVWEKEWTAQEILKVSEKFFGEKWRD